MIYEPAEDSLLLKKHIRDYSKNKKILDMGTGSGILALEAKKYTKDVTSSDINKECELKDIRFIQSDLFENIKDRYDLIIFNPPYLPEDRREDKESALTTTGGKKGYEILERFILELRDHLNDNGKALIVFSSLTKRENVESAIRKNKFYYRVLEEKKVPFETIYCYLLF